MGVASQVLKKLALEKTYTPEVLRVFRKMARDFRVSVAATGVQPRADNYRSQWATTIDNHVERVQRAFRGEAFRRKQRTEEEDEELLALALLRWRERYTADQTTLITATNERDQVTALRLGRQSLEEEGDVVTNRSLALTATAILISRYKSRTTTVTMSQTQTSAESTKFIEAEVEGGLTPRIIAPQFAPSKVNKDWHTVGDSKVRPSHRAANGQRRSLNQAFLVGGERLLFPGDPSQGATAGNVINCRCTALYDGE